MEADVQFGIVNHRGEYLMSVFRKLKIIVPILLVILLFTACSIGEKRYELTNNMGRTVASFKRRSGMDLIQQGNGLFLKKNVIQVMAPEGKVTSIMLLKKSKRYSIYNVSIGTAKKEAEPLLKAAFGKEISKNINSSDNSVTYTYLNSEEEVYVTFDTEKNTVTEISCYSVQSPKADEKKTQIQAQVKAGELIALIGDTNVYYNEAMVYLKSVQANYEAEYGKDIWSADIFGEGKTFGKMIKDEVIKQITELKIIKEKAKEMKVTLDEEEMARAKSYAKEHYEGLTTKDIKQYHVTKELLEIVYADNLLANKMFENVTINVDTHVPDEEAKQITVQDILIYGVEFDEAGNQIALSKEEKKNAHDKAKSLLKEAKKTEDFHALAEANSQADTLEYTFGKGEGPKQFGVKFEQTAFALKTGEISKLIKTDSGWHILYCVSDFNVDATTQVKEKIIEQRRTKMFEELYSKWSAEYEIIVNKEAWDQVTY